MSAPDTSEQPQARLTRAEVDERSCWRGLSPTKELPVPGLDMEGEDAADFIEQIAELYTGVDRWHVRMLAAHLRTPEAAEPVDPPITKDELSELASDMRSAYWDADSAASRLRDASDLLEDVVKKLRPSK